MSKPDRAGELRDVNVKAISLVSKAANGERFKIFKSAEDEAPEVVEKDERGLFHALKKFFTGDDEVEKGEVSDIYHANKSGSKLFEAFNALMKVLGLSRWDDDRSTPETDTTKIISALDDFRNVAIEILLGKNEVEKSGRKISGDRLTKLKGIQAMLEEVLSGLDEKDTEETEELTKEDIQKAVQEVVKPLVDRIEKVENARGISNRVQEETALEKGVKDFWGEIF